jgi:hypothetical protein
MLKISELTTVHEGIQTNLKKMEAAIKPAEQKIEELTRRSGDTYTQEHINKKVQEARSEISDQLYKLFGEINAAADEAGKSKKFYESVTFMLSRTRFHDDDGINATMKLAAIAEFEHMDFEELVLVAQAAKFHKQFARLWTANLAARSKNNQRDKADIAREWGAFEDVQLPEQITGLDLLKKISQGKAAAELLMRGSVVSPFQRKISTSERLSLQLRAGLA